MMRGGTLLTIFEPHGGIFILAALIVVLVGLLIGIVIVVLRLRKRPAEGPVAELAAGVSEKAPRIAFAERLLLDAPGGPRRYYDYGFRARLIIADEKRQSFFGALSDEIAAYPGLKVKESHRHLRVYKGAETVALVFFRRQSLYVALALDPAAYAGGRYRIFDLSAVRRFHGAPLALKLTSLRQVRHAAELLAVVCERLGLTKGEVAHTEFAQPRLTQSELIAAGLVKVRGTASVLPQPPARRRLRRRARARAADGTAATI